MSSSDWYKDIPLSLKIHGDMNDKTVCPLCGSVVRLGLRTIYCYLHKDIFFHLQQS